MLSHVLMSCFSSWSKNCGCSSWHCSLIFLFFKERVPCVLCWLNYPQITQKVYLLLENLMKQISSILVCLELKKLLLEHRVLYQLLQKLLLCCIANNIIYVPSQHKFIFTINQWHFKSLPKSLKTVLIVQKCYYICITHIISIICKSWFKHASGCVMLSLGSLLLSLG